jgi:hypothetical protein
MAELGEADHHAGDVGIGQRKRIAVWARVP